MGFIHSSIYFLRTFIVYVGGQFEKDSESRGRSKLIEYIPLKCIMPEGDGGTWRPLNRHMPRQSRRREEIEKRQFII